MATKKRVPSRAKAKRPASKPSRAKSKQRAADPPALAERLAQAIPDALCELRFQSPFELLIATILAAQSTDRTVNQVMPQLLARFPDAQALAAASQEEVEGLILRTGFFRNKAKAIRGAAQQLVERHGGQVPRTIEELVQLPGVARKTANVVLGTAYRVAAGFVVDTHVTRVSYRLGLTEQTDPVRIEQDLCVRFPREAWIDLGHRLVLHGRYTCLAKSPRCPECPLNELCPSHQAEPQAPWPARAQAEAQRVASALA
jgi:endonuclease-3